MQLKKTVILKKILDQVTQTPIHEITTESLLRNFFKNVPAYIIVLLCEGYVNEMLPALRDFFGEDINNTLQTLNKEDKVADVLASDISEMLNKLSLKTDVKPSIKLINALWQNRVGLDYLGNPYARLVFAALGNIPIDNIIPDVDLALSENFIGQLFYIMNIVNDNGKYSLKDLQVPNSIASLRHEYWNVRWNKKPITSFDLKDVEQILEAWLAKVEAVLKNDEANGFKQIGLISVFYRYVQWGSALNLDNNPKKLSNFIVSYLDNKKITIADKKNLIELITAECRKYKDPHFQSTNPLERLFNNDKELINRILNISKKEEIRYIDDFKATVEAV